MTSKSLVPRLAAALALLAFFPVSSARAQDAVRKEGVRVVKADISPPLRSMERKIITDDNCGLLMVDPGEVPEQRPGTDVPDPVVQDWTNWFEIPGPAQSFDGPPNLCGCAPPDPNGAVGPNHVVVMDNLHFAIYDKTGTELMAPTANNTLWSGFGGDCETDNSGDPVVVYDQLADRWLLTQFTASGPTFFECVALSTSGDPLGTYQRYAINTGTSFPDYPKVSMWPDAYYVSTREFPSGGGQDRPGAYAMDRVAMLGGSLSPTIIGFVVGGGVPVYRHGDGLLPSDLDGFTLPPAGSPNYFIGSADNGGPDGAPFDMLNVWEFHADFVTPGNSTFAHTTEVAIAPYDTIFPCAGRNCIPQPVTTTRLDHQGYRQRPIFRAAYRNFGTHESIVTNQSVEGVPNISGIRWWELRDPGGTPTIFQEGTYAPGATDGIHRWFGSIAMDKDGNMGLGYSASDNDMPVPTGTFPSVWYTGRLSTDPLGTMPQGEASIVDGTGAQTGGGSRWGDYSSMDVDPVDDCTFWYVNEYIPTTSSAGWRLRIGSFAFPECTGGPPAGSYCSTPGVAIPDNDPTGVSDDLVISGVGRDILDLDLFIEATHTWVGDLAFTLTHDGGTSTTPFDRPGVPASTFGCSGDDILTTLDDEATDPVENECGAGVPTIDGTFTPNVALSAYDGQSIDGTWTLQAVDAAGGDTGTLDQWCVVPVLDPMPFIDGFESGDTSMWTLTVN